MCPDCPCVSFRASGNLLITLHGGEVKTLLLMLIVAVCALAWRSDELMELIGARPQRVPALTIVEKDRATHRPMSAHEFAELSKTDPAAYQRFINSYRVEEERSEFDKLMNFLARGKYE